MISDNSKTSSSVLAAVKNLAWRDVLDLSNTWPDKKYIEIDGHDLLIHNEDLFNKLVESPDTVIPQFRQAVADIPTPKGTDLTGAEVRFVNMPELTPISDIRSDHVLRFVSVRGVVRRESYVLPRVYDAAFRCLRCGNVVNVKQNLQSFVRTEPYFCENDNCGKRGPFETDDSLSKFVDFQKLVIQEIQDDKDASGSAKSIDAHCMSSLTGAVVSGERVVINGVLRSMPKATKAGKSQVYEIFLDVNSIERIDKGYDLEITPEDEDAIEELQTDPRLFDRLVASVGPSIFGDGPIRDAKEAIVLQLFSGVRVEESKGVYRRGDIHILIMGDPGVAKSQLVRSAVALSPRGVYANGKSSSACGLTAAVVKDEDGNWAVDCGALISADGGLCVIDELDKMNDNDRNALLEGMEQQTISITKAGKNDTYNCRCSVLAAANPKDGRFNQYLDLQEQINLSEPLLSRFDLKFLIMDVPNADTDEWLTDRVLDIVADDQLPAIDTALLRKYIAKARRIEPVMTAESKKLIKNTYLSLRKASSGGSVSVTARLLNGLTRLSEASARMRMSDTVTAEDANRAAKLVLKSMNNTGINPDTGVFDADVISAGYSRPQRDKMALVVDTIKRMAKTSPQRRALISDVLQHTRSEGMTDDETNLIISKMRERGEITRPNSLELIYLG